MSRNSYAQKGPIDSKNVLILFRELTPAASGCRRLNNHLLHTGLVSVLHGGRHSETTLALHPGASAS